MRKVVVAPSFERSLSKLSPSQRKQLAVSLEDFNHFVLTGTLLLGLGFKKLCLSVYEFRVDIRLRVVTRLDAGVFYLIFVGSHDDVRRYLRE